MINEVQKKQVEFNDPLLNNDNLQSTQQQQYKEYNYRWIVFTFYILGNLSVSAMWATVAPISPEIQTVYPNVSGFLVSLVTMSMPIMYIIMNFPSIYILDGYGLKLGLIIGSSLTVLGLWMRTLINQSFIFVLLGQAIGGMGQPFFLNSPAKIATFWFNQKNRPVITGILSLINPLGVGIGFAIPPLFVSQNSDNSQMFNLMFWEALIFSVLTLPTIFLIKSKPPTPPSAGAAAKKLEFKKSLKQLLKNKNFFMILAGFAFVTSNFSTLAALIGVYSATFDFKSSEASIIGASTVIFGLFGGIAGGIILRKYQQYKKSIIAYNIMAVISFSLLVGFLFLQNFGITLFTAFLFGFFNIGMIPLFVDFACEVTFPTGEATTMGVMHNFNQFINVFQVLIVSALFPTNSEGKMKKSNVIFANSIGLSLLLVSLFLNFIVKEDLKRKNHEKQSLQQQIEQEQDFETIKYKSSEDDSNFIAKGFKINSQSTVDTQ